MRVEKLIFPASTSPLILRRSRTKYPKHVKKHWCNSRLQNEPLPQRLGCVYLIVRTLRILLSFCAGPQEPLRLAFAKRLLFSGTQMANSFKRQGMRATTPKTVAKTSFLQCGIEFEWNPMLITVGSILDLSPKVLRRMYTMNSEGKGEGGRLRYGWFNDSHNNHPYKP